MSLFHRTHSLIFLTDHLGLEFMTFVTKNKPHRVGHVFIIHCVSALVLETPCPACFRGLSAPELLIQLIPYQA